MNAWRQSLDGFTLDTEKLWTTDGGPRWSSALGDRLKRADEALRGKFRSGAVGFYDWPNQISKTEIARLKSVAERIKREFEGALVFGIGGSYLGAASLLESLTPTSKALPVAWLSNIDPPAVKAARRFCEERRTTAVVISKSGNTTETMAGFFHLSPLLDPKGYIAVTDPQKGELRRMAKEGGWESFDVPPAVGGRFSVLTAVGLLPCLLGGLDVDPILAGAKAMRARCESAKPEENPAYRFALALHLWDTEHRHPVQYLMPYWSSLRLFADWYVQLWGESLGKFLLASPNVSVGPTPVAALGTTDQHSQLQLFKEGPRDKVVGFVDVLGQGDELMVGEPAFTAGDLEYLCPHSFEKISSLACRATQTSLDNSGVPTYRIEIPKLDGGALGALLFFYETACALAGELYGVDAFNQPGVEESKNILRASLDG